MRRVLVSVAIILAAGTVVLPTAPAAARALPSAGRQGIVAVTSGAAVRGYPNLPQMIFNASPEPVRRGGTVTLRASATDGWEGYARVRIRFYFRAEGNSHYVYKGSALTRCVAYCGSGDIAYYRAKKGFVQRSSGTWKALTVVRYEREDGYHTRILRAYDAVLVRG